MTRPPQRVCELLVPILRELPFVFRRTGRRRKRRKSRKTIIAAGALVSFCVLVFAAWLVFQAKLRATDKVVCHAAARQTLALRTITAPKATAPKDAISKAQASRSTTAAVTGKAAEEQLRKKGQYESLAAAFQAARYAVEKIDPNAPYSRGAEYFASNPKQHLRAWFRDDGIELASGGGTPKGIKPWRLALRLQSVGRAGTFEHVESGEINALDNRVEIGSANDNIVELFENNVDGIEHAFVVKTAPAGRTGSLEITLAIKGNLKPREVQEQQSRAIAFANADGQEMLRYQNLNAFDATGRPLRSRMRLRDQQLLLVVTDFDAQYPITVDPLFANVQQRLTELIPAGLEPNFSESFGLSLAISGETVLIGAPDADAPNITAAGCAYVFVRNNQKWFRQVNLRPADPQYRGYFGSSVALSGDTAVIGAPAFDDGAYDTGTAYVFIRTGTTWSQQEKLIATDGGGQFLYFGSSVAVDGDTAAVGAYPYEPPIGEGTGAVYVFARSSNSWNQQTKLVADDGLEGDSFGTSIALARDTLLIGAPGSDASGINSGAAYVFVRNVQYGTNRANS